MKKMKILGVVFLLALAMGLKGSCFAKESPPARTALDDYVYQNDGSFSWEVVKSDTSGDMQTFVLTMNSQTWRTKEEVDRPVWQHWITIAVPKNVKSETGFMFVGGGGNGGKAPDGPDERTQEIARATQTVVAAVHMIPNQPLVFYNDGQRRTEDDLVAYTWVKFLETGDPTWPARNPMVKGVVRAMDAVTEFMASEDGGKRKVDKYVVAGGSKRGWTTWLVGAVDKRVVGIVPIVIDILNLEKSMGHHFAAYGFFAPSIVDYVEHKLVQMPTHPRMQELFALVDPYRYRHRLKMPKLVLNAAGDQFFPPDLSRHYFDDLEGEKILRYVPNTDHGLGHSDALDSVVAFYSMILADKQLPEYSWERPEENIVRVKTAEKPEKVVLWQAVNPDGRDFRLETLGPEYKSSELKAQDDGSFVAEVDVPEKGFKAYFVELTYDVGAPTPLKVTTSVGIVPDVFPFADKDPTLPTSLTLRFTAPNEAIVQFIKGALQSSEMQEISEDPQLTTSGELSDGGISVVLNWIPKGPFEKGAVGISGYLKKIGCSNFVFQIESGRLTPAKK